jgi:Ca-activated chloride channel homolog
MRPLTILGKYRGSPTGAIVVKGKTARGPFEQRLELKEARTGETNSALRLLWARQRIMHLADFSRFDPKNQDLVKEVTALGLKYSLLTPYTSFVAVDQVKRADGQVVTVKQPLPLPEGVSDLAIGEAKSRAMMPSMMPGSPSRLMAKDESMGYMGGVRKPKTGPHGGGSVPAEPVAPKVSVTVQNVQVKGGLAPAVVQKALEDELVKLTQCCQDAVKAGLKLPAELTVTFTIGLDGKITGAPKVSLAATHKTLKNCLAESLKGIQFPQTHKAAVPVTLTLSLTEK